MSLPIPHVSPRQVSEDATDLELLAFEVARNQVGAQLPAAELLNQLGVAPAEFLRCTKDKLFQQAVRMYKREMEEGGVSFQLKAAIIAEDGLSTLYGIIHNSDELGATRLKALDKAVEWGSLAPTTDAGTPGAGAPMIVFNFPEGVSAPPALSMTDGAGKAILIPDGT